MQKDQRIHYIASQDGTLGIAENTNQAYTLATGDYIVFGDHDDLFEPDALYACVESLNAKRVQVIYTDEDKVDETGDYFLHRILNRILILICYVVIIIFVICL